MQSALPLILSVGELLWDLLPAGTRLGGAPANLAVLSAHLGNQVALISRTGRDSYGEGARNELSRIIPAANSAGHFDLTLLQLSDDLPTGTVSVSFGLEHQPHYVIDEPVAWDQITLTPELLTLAKRASAICFGTLAQRQPCTRATIRALVEASTADCLRVCDVNLRLPFGTAETLLWCFDHATLLKISDEELPTVAHLLGLSPISKPNLRDPDGLTAWALDAASTLLRVSRNCRLMAITLGPHGSLLTDGVSFDRHPGIPTKVIDTVGAGDAFTAGMVHALLRAGTLHQANAVSNLCGSFVAGQPGATPQPTPALLKQIEQILGRP